MSGGNCILSVKHFGVAKVWATQVAYGMDVITYAPDGESRAGAAFYPAKRADSDIDVTLIFGSQKRFRDMNRWLQRYVDKIANPNQVAVPMRITVPSRNFDMVAVLKDGITFGRKVGDVTRGMTLSFAGARSPVEIKASQVSIYSSARNKSKDPALVYFYPGGTQLKNTAYGWDTLYDQPSGASLLTDDGGPLADVLHPPGY